jgi:hypothetical protein
VLAQAELAVALGRRAPRGVPAVELRQERSQDGRLELVEAGVVADELERLLVPRAVEASIRTASSRSARGVETSRRRRRREVLGREERERRRIPEPPDRRAVEARAEGLGGILDQGQAVPLQTSRSGPMARDGRTGGPA